MYFGLMIRKFDTVKNPELPFPRDTLDGMKIDLSSAKFDQRERKSTRAHGEMGVLGEGKDQ